MEKKVRFSKDEITEWIEETTKAAFRGPGVNEHGAKAFAKVFLTGVAAIVFELQQTQIKLDAVAEALE